MTPHEIEQLILYRDAMVIILNKPAGIPVHPGPKGGENLEQYFTHLRFGWQKDPALAHRLDRDTSGCLVLGRHPKALRKLGILFQEGKVEKTYWAVVHGHLPQKKGRIDLPLAKRSKDTRSWWVKVDHEEGKPSVTDYEVLGEAEGYSWVACHPRTGRTHQIRVHMAAIGHPIVGEPIYDEPNRNRKDLPPLHLHSRAISLPLNPNKDPLGAEAPPPEHMLALLKRCGW